MVQILRHELKKQGNETVLFLYLDRNETEFAKELGSLDEGSKQDLDKSINSYISSKLPNLKQATVKVMVGGLLVTSFAFSPVVGGIFKGGDDRAQAAEVDYTGFPDISPNRESAPAIEALVKKGIIKGYPDGFHPREDISRQHAALMFVRALDLDTDNVTDPGFKDVPTTHPYYKEIAAATAAGFFNKADNFNPSGNFTRGQSASVIVRAYDLEGAKDSPFTDLTGSGHEEAIGIMYNLGLAKGTTGTTFNPNDNVKREQFAMLLHRTIEAKPITGTDALNYVQTQDFGYWADESAYNLGFKLNTDTLPYANISKIEVSLVGANNEVLATRTATGSQIDKLRADDVTYGGEDGQLSVAFKQRAEAASNEWWASSPYNLGTPTKAVVKIQDKNGKVYITETPTAVTGAPITGTDALNYVQTQDFGYWADQNAFNLGFKLNTETLPYANISKIEVSLVGANNEVLATRTATGSQIEKLRADDVTYGGEDGQLSVAFKQRAEAESNEWWASSPYNLGTPTKAVVKIQDNSGKVYITETTTAPLIPPITGTDASNYVQTQDFGYWADQNAYNLGFKLNTETLPYANISKIEVSLVGANNEVLATRTATGSQIEKLRADDVTYGGEDGQLSVAFKQRAEAESNEWWASSPYNLTAPTKAVVTIHDNTGKVYITETTTPPVLP